MTSPTSHDPVPQPRAAKPARERNSTIDIAKGLMILLVVFAHNPLLLQQESELQRVTYSAPLALFFLVTGFFFKADAPLGTFMRSRASSLLKPYFVVLLALAVVKIAKEALLSPSWPASLSLEYLGGIVYGTGRTIDWTPLWFLPSLFATAVFTLLVLKLLGATRRHLIAATALALVAVGAPLVRHFWPKGVCVESGAGAGVPPGLPWSLDLIPLTAPFMLIGYLLGPWARAFKINGIALAVALTAFVAMHALFDETIDLNCRTYGNPWVSTIQAYAGSYLALCLSSLLARVPACRAVLAYVGTGTIFILLFHGYIQNTALRLLSGYLSNAYVAAALSYLAGSLVPLAIMEITRRTALLGAALLPGSPKPPSATWVAGQTVKECT